MGEWVPAGKLRIGDAIRKADGRYRLVQVSTFVYQPQSMYNLTVADAHTYFVGDGQWLVHNSSLKCKLGKNWWGANSGDPVYEMEWHYNKWGGYWMSLTDYTNSALAFRDNYWNLRNNPAQARARGVDVNDRVPLADGSFGIKFTDDQLFGIYTKDGLIVSHGPGRG